MAIEKAPKHGGRETLAAIGDQAFLDFQQRHVRPAANETEQIVAMGLYTTGTTIKHAALKLMRKLLRKYAVVPDRLVTGGLRSYRAATLDLGIDRRHERGRWKNNRAENSHQPTRRRERKMQRFQSELDPGFRTIG